MAERSGAQWGLGAAGLSLEGEEGDWLAATSEGGGGGSGGRGEGCGAARTAAEPKRRGDQRRRETLSRAEE